MLAVAASRDGSPIAYESSGMGSPALVFVHGWSCRRQYWDAQLEAFSAGRRVIALDLAGHGQSGAARRAWSVEAFAEDVAAVVDDAGIDDAILVGHSMGADVVLEASRHLRGRVRGLVWVDEHRQLTSFRSEAQVAERLAPFRADFAAATESFVRRMFPASADASLVERVVADITCAPKAIALQALEATWNYARRIPERLADVGLPVVAMNSERSQTDIESMRRHGVDVVLLADVGHFPMLERPDEFNGCLLQVVGELCTGSNILPK